MAVHRAFHVTFYILFLIMLGVVLWFLLYYAGVPGWVWSLFGAALVIAIIGVIIKEVLIKKKEAPCTGEILSPNPLAGWSLAYYIFHVIAFLLIITGIVLVIIYGNYPWWLWILLGVGVALIIIAAMMHVGSAERGIKITAFVLAVIGTITLAVFEVLLVVYADAPWWIWVLIAVMILFGILSGGLEPISAENLVAPGACPKPCPETVPLVSTGLTIRQSDSPPPPLTSQVMVAPTPSVVTSQPVAISGPPVPITAPSQIVVGATPPVTTSQPVITSAPTPTFMAAQPGITVNPTPGVTVSPPIVTGASYRSALPGMGFP
jgi:hypothetical protein